MKTACRGVVVSGLVCMTAIGLVAASRNALSAQINPSVSVVTSNTVLADLVANVGGDTVQVRALAPAGTDPHTFQPTPDAIRVLSQARIVFFNGAGLEEWWDKTIRSVKKPDVPVIELSKGLATIRMPGHSHAEGQDPQERDDRQFLADLVRDRK